MVLLATENIGLGWVWIFIGLLGRHYMDMQLEESSCRCNSFGNSYRIILLLALANLFLLSKKPILNFKVSSSLFFSYLEGSSSVVSALKVEWYFEKSKSRISFCLLLYSVGSEALTSADILALRAVFLWWSSPALIYLYFTTSFFKLPRYYRSKIYLCWACFSIIWLALSILKLGVV